MPFMDDPMLDLFGDEAVGDVLGDVLSVHEPEASSVILRIAQLQRSGCCQRLTWSRNGSLASISEDGRRINLRLFVRDPRSLKWTLTDDSPNPAVAPEDSNFVHVQWSNLGLDLVALDHFGRPHVYQLAYTLDRLQPHNFPPSHIGDDIQTPVGMHWLPIHPNQYRPPNISLGTRKGSDWSNTMGVFNRSWPHHPVDGRPAFLIVTESQLVKLHFQQEIGPWSEVSGSLWDSGTPEDLLTHAAFADADGFIYLTVHTSRGCLRVYKLTIEWSQSQSKEPRTLPAIQAQLKVELMHIAENIIPLPPSESAADVVLGMHRSQLSSLTMMQPPAPISEAESVSFSIYAIFTYVADSYEAQMPSSSGSVILSWDLASEEPELLDVFKTIGKGNVKLNAEAQILMKRRQDLVVPRLILSVASILFEPLMAVTYSDGSIEIRSRVDLQVLSATNDDSKASSLPAAGFAFDASGPCRDIAINANGSIAAICTASDQLQSSVTQYIPGWAGSSLENYQTQAALNTIARDIAVMIALQVSADEPMALLPLSFPASHRRYLIKQIYRILQRPFDFTQEESRKMSSRILRDQLSAKTLSLQLFLSYKDVPCTLDLPGKIVWITLNLRMILTNIASTVTPKEASRPDSVVALSGSVKWCIDLCCLMLEDLVASLRDLSQPITYQALVSYFAPSETPTLLVFLSSFPRSLLRMMIELLKMFSTKLAQCNPTTITQRVQVQELAIYYKNLPFKLPHLESVLQEIDSSVRSAYNSAKMSVAQRVAAETCMLVDGEIPQCLHKVAEHIFSDKIAGKMRESIDEIAMFSWDTTWLGLKGEGADEERRRWDVITKKPIRKGMKLRACKRCGSVMEDVCTGQDEAKRVLPIWLLTAQRNCACLGYWMVSRVVDS